MYQILWWQNAINKRKRSFWYFIPSNNKCQTPGFFEFFLATLKKPEVDPIQILYFSASIWVNDERRLRSLESKKSPKDTHVDCKLDKDFDEVSGYGCYSTQKVKGIIEENARLTIESESVRNIAGFPDKFDTDKMKVDYSDPEILKKIGELDKIKIIEIDGYNCHKNGQLNITGETNSEKELNIKDVDFSTPESDNLHYILPLYSTFFI